MNLILKQQRFSSQRKYMQLAIEYSAFIPTHTYILSDQLRHIMVTYTRFFCRCVYLTTFSLIPLYGNMGKRMRIVLLKPVLFHWRFAIMGVPFTSRLLPRLTVGRGSSDLIGGRGVKIMAVSKIRYLSELLCS